MLLPAYLDVYKDFRPQSFLLSVILNIQSGCFLSPQNIYLLADVLVEKEMRLIFGCTAPHYKS